MNGFLFWKDVIQKVQDHTGGTVIIAGGCVRDYMIGMPPKDIDVWTTGNPRTITGDIFGERATPEGFQFDNTLPVREEYEAGINGIREIEDYLYHDTKINVIYVHEAYGSVDRFDAQICQGVVDDGGLSLSPEALEDLERKRYTIHRMGPNSVARAERFLARVAEVEQGWEMVIADNEHNRNLQNRPAPHLLTNGNHNVAVGYQAGVIMNGVELVAVGYQAGVIMNGVELTANPPVIMNGIRVHEF